MSFSVQSFNFESLLTSVKMTALQDSVVHVKSAFIQEHNFSDANLTSAVHSKAGTGMLHNHTNVQSSDFAKMAQVGGAQLGGTGRDGSTIKTVSSFAGSHLVGNYVDFTIDSGTTYTFSGRGPCIIKTTSSIILNGVLNLNLAGGLGGNGATATDGDGFSGKNGLCGGVGGTGGAATGAGGAAGNAFGNTGSTVDVSTPLPPEQYVFLFASAGDRWLQGDVTTPMSYGGSGGGGGGATGASGAGRGGSGGGYVYLEAPTITIGTQGNILANGEDGQNATGGSNDAGGGGGGGGIIHLVYNTLNENTTINTPTGGIGGTGDGAGNNGLNGGDGLLIKQRKFLSI